MDGSKELADMMPQTTLRERIMDANYNACAPNEATPQDARQNFIRLLVCWLDDRDGQARSEGHEKGCSDDDILVFLRGLQAQKQKTRDAHLAAAKFIEAHADLEELRIINEFLPKKLPAAQLSGEIREVVKRLGATKLKDVPACIDALEARFPGQIDPKLAGNMMRDALG